MTSSSKRPKGGRKSAEKNTVLPLQQVDVPDRATPRHVDEFLLPNVAHLRSAYRRTGDPRLTRLAATGLVAEVLAAPAALASFQTARLFALIAETHMDEGRDVSGLEDGLVALSRAKEILGRVDHVSDEVYKARITYALHEGVLKKALGHYDDSISGMRQEKDWLLSRKGVSPVEVVMLDRQEILMQQEASGFRGLLDAAPGYATVKPIEYYATVRRVFEFCLNKQLMANARQLFPEFRRAFRSVAAQLPMLSHVSFAKNVGQFALLIGRVPEAERILSRALHWSKVLHLHGQERQITSLLENLRDGKPHILLPFLVGV